MKAKKDYLSFILTALLWGAILGLGVIGETQAHCVEDEPPGEEYDYYIVYTV